MSVKAFVDTNILVYARDAGAGAKQGRAAVLLDELWSNRSGRISAQVLNEYFVTVTRKLSPGLSAEEAWSDLVALSVWNPIPWDWKLMERARRIFSVYKLSWWDALVVAAAESADCEILYSEDLSAKQMYGNLRVVNPFSVP